MPGLSSQGLLDEGNATRHGNSPLSLCAAPSQALGLIREADLCRQQKWDGLCPGTYSRWPHSVGEQEEATKIASFSPLPLSLAGSLQFFLGSNSLRFLHGSKV